MGLSFLKWKVLAESTSGTEVASRPSGSSPGMLILRPRSAKLRLKSTTGSVGILTNLVGADGSDILFLWPDAIRSRASEKRGAVLDLEAAETYGRCGLLGLQVLGSPKLTFSRVGGRVIEFAAAEDELPLSDEATPETVAGTRVLCSAAMPASC